MPSPQKVVAVAYERCSFTRGSNYWDMTWKTLVFWIGGSTVIQNSLIATTMVMVVNERVNGDNS